VDREGIMHRNLRLTRSSEPGFGLALGGGAVLGYTHVGVLAALAEAELQPVAISGTSAGAVVAALHAFGVPVEVIKKHLADLTWPEITGLTRPVRGLLSNRALGRWLVELIGDVRIEVLTNAVDIARAANSAHLLATADVAIKPELNGFNRFDVRQCPALFEVGYAAAREAVPDIRAALARVPDGSADATRDRPASLASTRPAG
jgi:predicted acylesterase/phospholipase RssA